MVAGKWKIKVCGMSLLEQMIALARLPVDYMGIILVPESPRFAGKHETLAPWLLEQEENFAAIKKTGVFVNAPIEEVMHAMQDYGLSVLQLHGDESADYCRELLYLCEVARLPKPEMIKAVSIDGTKDIPSADHPLQDLIDYWLFDTKGPLRGGNGRTFDWSVLGTYQEGKGFFLSGGIGPEHVPALAAFSHPLMRGLDINSRFESGPGVKDLQKIEDFIQELSIKLKTI